MHVSRGRASNAPRKWSTSPTGPWRVRSAARSRVAFALGGLPTPVLQAVILLRDGGRARVDFLWAQWRVIGEADGRLKIQRPEDLWQEKLREDRLRELGYEVVRWTWDEIVNHPEVVVARILRAAARASHHT